MKQLLPVLVLVLASVSARGAAAQYETVDGVRWAYTVTNGEATIGAGDMTPAVDAAISGALRIPSGATSLPVDLNERREGHPEPVAEWMFDKPPETAHAWYEIADFGLVGDENDNWVSWYQSDDPQTGGGYLAFDSFRGIRFPISEDLRTHDVSLSFRMKFIPLEECPALADSRLSVIEVHPVIRIVGCQVGVKDRFWLFAVVDNPDYVEEVRLGVLSDRAYITDTRLPWRYVNYRTDVDWCNLVARMDGEGVTLLCNGDTVRVGGMKKFPYATAATDTKVAWNGPCHGDGNRLLYGDSQGDVRGRQGADGNAGGP